MTVYFLNLNSKSNINDKDFYSFLKSNITDSWYFYFKTKTYSYFHKISHRRLNFSTSSNPKTSITDDNLYSYRKTDIRLDKRHAKPSNRPATRRRQTARKSAWKQGRSPASPLAERVKQQSCLPYLKTVRSGLRLGRHRRWDDTRNLLRNHGAVCSTRNGDGGDTVRTELGQGRGDRAQVVWCLKQPRLHTIKIHQSTRGRVKAARGDLCTPPTLSFHSCYNDSSP